jgi:hypothetical protein
MNQNDKATTQKAFRATYTRMEGRRFTSRSPPSDKAQQAPLDATESSREARRQSTEPSGAACSRINLKKKHGYSKSTKQNSAVYCSLFTSRHEQRAAEFCPKPIKDTHLITAATLSPSKMSKSRQTTLQSKDRERTISNNIIKSFDVVFKGKRGESLLYATLSNLFPSCLSFSALCAPLACHAHV